MAFLALGFGVIVLSLASAGLILTGWLPGTGGIQPDSRVWVQEEKAVTVAYRGGDCSPARAKAVPFTEERPTDFRFTNASGLPSPEGGWFGSAPTRIAVGLGRVDELAAVDLEVPPIKRVGGATIIRVRQRNGEETDRQGRRPCAVLTLNIDLADASPVILRYRDTGWEVF